jgi:hypothetical protein
VRVLLEDPDLADFPGAEHKQLDHVHRRGAPAAAGQGRGLLDAAACPPPWPSTSPGLTGTLPGCMATKSVFYTTSNLSSNFSQWTFEIEPKPAVDRLTSRDAMCQYRTRRTRLCRAMQMFTGW